MSLTETWLKAQYQKQFPKGFVKADRDGLSVRVQGASVPVIEDQTPAMNLIKRQTPHIAGFW